MIQFDLRIFVQMGWFNLETHQQPDKSEIIYVGKNRDQGLKIEEPLGRYPFPVSNAGPPAGLSQRFETREETSGEVGGRLPKFGAKCCKLESLKCYFNSYAHRII